MNYQELLANYIRTTTVFENQLKQKETKTIEDQKVIDFLKSGFSICDNDNVKHQDVLVLCGINPSGNGIRRLQDPIHYHFNDAQGRYWTKKHKQFGGKDSLLVKEHMAYFDLFPFIKTEQRDFEKIFKDYNQFRFNMVSITAKAIEDFHPRLIVHANKDSLYYWGLNPNSFKEDSVYSWLGYSFKDVTRDCPILAEYKKRIAEKAKGKEYVFLFEISGGGFTSKTYFLTYTMERYGMKTYQRVQLLTPNEMLSLWDWCCSQ